MAEAEALRGELGFAWAETRLNYDYSELSGYGRIYPKLREMSDAEAETFNANALRMEEIARGQEELAGTDDAETEEAVDAEIATLNGEYDRIEMENDTLREAFDPEDAARAGVIACFSHGTVRFELGLVRPEDALAVEGETSVGAGDSAPANGTASSAKGALSMALKTDLAIERAELVSAALAHDTWLAYDAVVFRLAVQFFVSGQLIRGGIAVTLNPVHGSHSRPEARLPYANDRIEAIHDGLDLSFLEDGLTAAEKFAAFRALNHAVKSRILARIVAAQVEPQLWTPKDADSFAEALFTEAVPDVRPVWHPTAANYWSRVSKGHILDVLHSWGLDDLAQDYGSLKKAQVAERMESLIKTPPKRLTDQQRATIEGWVPEGMQPPCAGTAQGTDGADDGSASEPQGTGDDPDNRVPENSSDPEVEEAAA